MPIRAPHSADGSGSGSPLRAKVPEPLDADCDVLVVGGGPAGLAAAIRLRMMTPLKVLVADARAGDPSERFGETVPPGTLAALDRLGLATAFRSDGHLACPGGLSLWGSSKPGHNDHVLDPYGPAWHLDRRVFEKRLRTRAVELGVVLRTGVRLAAAGPELWRTPPGPHWIVDASGSSRWLAHRLGINLVRYDRMVAILGFATIESAGLGEASAFAARTDCTDFTAQTLVEATPYGWWYASRLPANRIVSALITTPAAAGELVKHDGRQWFAARARTTLLAPALARCQLRPEPLITRGTSVSILHQLAGPNWLAVGDAASERDPITGSGIHDALLDGADAAWTIAAATGHRPAPPWRYEQRVQDRFEAHLQTRALLYASERRWPTTRFWSGRLNVR